MRARFGPNAFQLAKIVARQLRRFGGARSQSIEISSHQLSHPSCRHVAGERHRPLVSVDGKNGAYQPMVGTLGVMDLERKKQGRSRQRLDLVVAEIELVKVGRAS